MGEGTSLDLSEEGCNRTYPCQICLDGRSVLGISRLVAHHTGDLGLGNSTSDRIGMVNPLSSSKGSLEQACNPPSHEEPSRQIQKIA